MQVAWRLELLEQFYIDNFTLSCTLPPGCGTGSSVSITWAEMQALYGEVRHPTAAGSSCRGGGVAAVYWPGGQA